MHACICVGVQASDTVAFIFVYMLHALRGGQAGGDVEGATVKPPKVHFMWCWVAVSGGALSDPTACARVTITGCLLRVLHFLCMLHMLHMLRLLRSV